MPKTITQRVVFKNTTASELYELYMNAKKHSAATGTVTKISEKEGAKYSAGDDYITGKNLVLVKNKMIVQTWKAADWDKDEQDSIFILTFEQQGKNFKRRSKRQYNQRIVSKKSAITQNL